MIQPLYLPFTDGQWRMSMGLKALNSEQWIEIDNHLVEELALKEKLLHNHYGDVFASLPGSELSQQEVLDLLINHLLQHYPQHYRQQGTTLKNLKTQQVWTITDFQSAPLDLAGRLVQDDLLLMQPSLKGYILTAASLCFPSRWRLQDKLGHPLVQIHAPVPGYQDKLKHPVDNFFDRLRVEHPAWRLNWSIVDTPELFLPEATRKNGDTRLDANNAGENLWIRMERQTLRRLKVSGDILFTVRTYVHPLNVLQDKPAIAFNLAATIKQMPMEMQRYKNLLPIRDALLGYLEQLQAADTFKNRH